MAYLMTTIGEIKEIRPYNGFAFTYDELRKHVEGNACIIPMHEVNHANELLVINKDACMLGLDHNRQATMMARFTDYVGEVRGNAMVCDNNEIDL